MKALRKLAALVLAGALCMSMLVGCGIDPEETAATYGEEQVSLGFVNFMAKYQKSTADDLYVGYFGTGVWDYDMSGSGVTLKEQLLAYSEKEFLKKQGLFTPEYTSNMVRHYLKTGDGGPATGANFSKICWSFYAFQQWYCHYHK